MKKMTKSELIETQANRMCEILNGLERGEISDQDLEDLQTFVAISIELMNLSSRTNLKQSALAVELRFHLRSVTNGSGSGG
jgi:hypothetical protein